MLVGGGVVDWQGDPRERARENARETLVVLGGFAPRAGGFGLADHEPVEGCEGPRDATTALRAVPTQRRAHEQGLVRPRTGASPSSFLLGSVFVWRSRDGRSSGVFGRG